ncbi:MAG: NADH-quinone oxidoreductase subunit G [Planctomycetota bacterium]|nr:MAG: NADH-quinone oxidoreductase subunit G [Planctomycetota bacterium]
MSTLKLTIDGREVEVAPGTTILDAARDELGIEIPHYCYHRDIGTDGNCRVCLVEVNGNTNKLAISCQLPCGNGMNVETNSDAVVKARKGVMEFLLINHPLDCTICDQAGECPLQEYSYDYGSGDSRFDEAKRHKVKKTPFSDDIMYDGERCILCQRCTRFFDVLRGSRPIGVENMGGQTTITLGPNGPIDDAYSMNIVDICPVGALTSRDFRFKQRVWFMDFTETVCPGCARGCNMTAGAYQGKLLRFVPERNADVNKSWMCDEGRQSVKDYNFQDRPDRIHGCKVRGQSVMLSGVAEGLDELLGDGSGVAVLASTRETCEDLFALATFCEAKGVTQLWHGASTWQGDDFLRCDDATPNTAGATQLGYAPVPAEAPKLRGLIVAGDVEVPAALLAELDWLVVQSVIESSLTVDAATVVLPCRTPLEKRGTYVNVDGISQQVRPALDPGDKIPESWALWGELLIKLEDWPDVASVRADMQAWLASRGAAVGSAS